MLFRILNTISRASGLAIDLLILALLSSTLVLAQVNQGRIGGTVTDQSGGAIVGATVTVTDVERGVTRTLTTDGAGAYGAPNLTPGNYTVHAEFAGFKAINRQDITVAVGSDVRIDLLLEPGEQTQTVTVTGEPPAINTTNAQLGGTIEGSTATDLPIAGRSFVYLLNYVPGILTKPGAGGGLIQYTNGLRPEYNVYVFDGLADTNSYGAAGPLNIGFIAGGPDESVILPVDAVQDFNLVEHPKAEYGWRPGGQISMGLKSGTNTLHGTAFALGRSTSMVTRNPFFKDKAPTEFENWGATFGGPIKKDQWFYYLGYEAQNYNVGNPRTLTVPTTVSLGGPTVGRSGSVPDAAADMLLNRGYTAQQMALGLALSGCSVAGSSVSCVPGKGVFSNAGASTSMPTLFSTYGGTQNGVAKVDYHINDKNNVNLDFFRGIGNVVTPVSGVTQPYWSSPLLGSVTVGRLVWAMVPSSRLVNEVRTGWDYSLQSANPSPDCSADSGAPNYASLGFVTGAQICGFPTTVISGFGSATAPTLGQPQGISAKSLNLRFSDNLSLNTGQHTWKFGVEYARQIFDGVTSVNLSKGTLNFGTAGTPAFTGATALQDFLAMVPQSTQLQIGDLRRTVFYNQYAFYAQDDWRVVPRLTLNLGLRYEFSSFIHEKNNLLANFDPTSPTGMRQDDGSGLYRSYPYNFGPRIGLAWDTFGNGRTVVRLGGGIMYHNFPAQAFMPLNAAQAGMQNMPTGWNMRATATSPIVTTPNGNINLGTVTISTPGPILANTPIFGALTAPGVVGTCTGAAPCKIGGAYSRIVTPQVIVWNIGIQRALNNSLTLDVSYVGNHGQHMFNFIDANQPLPGVAGAAAENLRRPYVGQFPWLSSITTVGAYQYSNYNGLQVSLKEREWHGVNFTVGYTYAHSLDQTIGDVQATIPQDSRNPQAEYGNGIQDVRHRFTVQGRYAIPGKKSTFQALEGWQLTTALQIWSALPYSPVDPTGDPSGVGSGQDRWSIFGNASDFNGFGMTKAIPCFGATGSTFANAGCTVGLPQVCIDAANKLPINPSVPSTNAGATGLGQLSRWGCYVSGNSVILPPAQGTFGNMSRYMLRGQGFNTVDLSIMKNWLFKERWNVQFRAEVYNLLNSTQFASLSTPNGANLQQPNKFGASTGTPNIIGQSPIIGNGDTRRIQLGLRFQF